MFSRITCTALLVTVFTTTGHFIVLVGVEDGKIRVHDPNSTQRSNQLWRWETLEYQIKGLWVFHAL